MAGKTKGEDKEEKGDKEDKEDKNKDEEDWRRRVQKRICRRAVESVQPHTAMCICTSRGKGEYLSFQLSRANW